MFIHAILGCGTTSRLYGLGKGLSLKRFTSSALFRDKAEQFCKKDATVDDVIDAGEAALVCLYSGNEGENLDGLRYAKYLLTRCISLLRLCPRPLQQRDTTTCEYTCSYRSDCMGVCNMKETDWGWMTKDDNLVPVMTDLPPAPDELLRVIRFNCTTDWSTARCSCRIPQSGVFLCMPVGAEVSDVPTAPRLI